MGTRGTDLPPPTSLEEVGDRLNEIRGDLNRIEKACHKEISRIDETLGAEIQRVTRDASERADKLDNRIAKQTNRTLGERKREGTIFLGGILCQIVGAVVILAC